MAMLASNTVKTLLVVGPLILGGLALWAALRLT